MYIRKRAIELKRRRHRLHRFCNLSVNDIIRLISSLILPLTLGVFTIFITVHQHLAARENRRDDLNRFEDQRREDRNETRLQREHEWSIAKMNQKAQNKVAVDRYQDEVFVIYIKEIGDLLKENNGSLTSNRLIATLARVKTLNVLRQLDGSRQIHVIRFLYEARQLTDTDELIALDISTVELTNIDFHHSTWSGVIEKISLSGVYLRNSTFETTRLIDRVNFTSARFDNVNFSSTILNEVVFSFARFRFTNFSFTKLYDVNISSAMVSDTNFSSTNFTHDNLGSTWFKNINFSFAWMSKVNFSFAWFSGVNFSSTTLQFANFSSSEFARIPSNFHYAKINHALFDKCNCKMADFSYANLSTTIFSDANLKNVSFQNADLTEVNFSRANLWNADLTNTTITDNQLQTVLSIRNAKLPNGTLGRIRNLIENGDANCNIPFIHPWHVQNGNITVMVSKENPKNCQFVLKSHIVGAIMWQQIDLVNIWDATIWPDSNVELHFYGNNEVSIELHGLNSNGIILHKGFSNSTENKILMKLQKQIQQLKVIVKFNAHSTNKYIWCDNIELFINYDILQKISTIYRS